MGGASAATVLAVVGPTASGKSAAAMAVARARGDVELVAVDAFTVYRGMDVGTAKPSPADRAAVPHHCLDLLDVDEDCDVSWFQQRARAAIADVLRRGRTPLLVGGSGLYFRAVVDDMRFPPTDPAVRAEIEQRYVDDPAGAHAAVVAADPEAAARIDPANLRRSVRALEVMALTGERFSTFAGTPYASVVGDLHTVLLDPPADALRARIDARAGRMVSDGLLAEVAALRQRFPRWSTTAAQAIGYAEAAQVLDGTLDQVDVADAIARRTRAYARRQRTWFRKDPRCADPARTVPDAITHLLSAFPPR